MKSNGVDEDDGGGNRDGFDESLLIPLRRDDDDDEGIGGGGGIGGPPIGNKDDRNGEDEAVGVGPNGGRRSVFVDMNRFRSSFRENDGR